MRPILVMPLMAKLFGHLMQSTFCGFSLELLHTGQSGTMMSWMKVITGGSLL